MTRDDVIARLCAVMEEAAEKVDPDCETANDCICSHQQSRYYRNDGKALEYVERAVRSAIARGDS